MQKVSQIMSRLKQQSGTAANPELTSSSMTTSSCSGAMSASTYSSEQQAAVVSSSVAIAPAAAPTASDVVPPDADAPVHVTVAPTLNEVPVVSCELAATTTSTSTASEELVAAAPASHLNTSCTPNTDYEFDQRGVGAGDDEQPSAEATGTRASDVGAVVAEADPLVVGTADEHGVDSVVELKSPVTAAEADNEHASSAHRPRDTEPEPAAVECMPSTPPNGPSPAWPEQEQTQEPSACTGTGPEGVADVDEPCPIQSDSARHTSALVTITDNGMSAIPPASSADVPSLSPSPAMSEPGQQPPTATTSAPAAMSEPTTSAVAAASTNADSSSSEKAVEPDCPPVAAFPAFSMPNTPSIARRPLPSASSSSAADPDTSSSTARTAGGAGGMVASASCSSDLGRSVSSTASGTAVVGFGLQDLPRAGSAAGSYAQATSSTESLVVKLNGNAANSSAAGSGVTIAAAGLVPKFK